MAQIAIPVHAWAESNEDHKVHRIGEFAGVPIEDKPNHRGIFFFEIACNREIHSGHILTRNEFEEGEFPSIGIVCAACEGRKENIDDE